MDKNGLIKKIELHEKWLNNESDGERLILKGEDLSGYHLPNANLSKSHLIGVNFNWSYLRGSDLSNAYIENVNFSHSDLRDVNLSNSAIARSNFNLTDIRNSDLSNAILYSDSFYGAMLNEANLTNVRAGIDNQYYYMRCPESGSYVGYKKCMNSRIVKLEIMEDSLRSSSTSNTCRASKVKVLDITDISGNKKFKEARSVYNKDVVYKVGNIVEVDDFDTDRWNTCSTGIHHFLNREEAVIY